MNEEYGYEPANNNKKIALIAGAVVLLLAVGVGVAVYLRSHQQAAPAQVQTNVNAAPVSTTNQNSPQPVANDGKPIVHDSGLIVDVPDVEYGKVYVATEQEKLSWGYAAGDKVTYIWTKPTAGSGSIKVVTNASAAPQLPDGDNDGLPDQDEVKYHGDPKNPDTDGDGLLDGVEVFQLHTDPSKADTDGDGVRDAYPVKKSEP